MSPSNFILVEIYEKKKSQNPSKLYKNISIKSLLFFQMIIPRTFKKIEEIQYI